MNHESASFLNHNASRPRYLRSFSVRQPITLHLVDGLLDWCWLFSILHVLVFGRLGCFSSLLCLLLGLSLGCDLGHLLCGLCFLLGGDSRSLLLDAVSVSLDDWSCDGTDLLDLGDVDGLGGVLAFVVEPVLFQ